MEQDLGAFVTKDLGGFDSLPPEKAKEVATKAAAIAPEMAKTFQVPKAVVPKIAKLAFYDYTILCGTVITLKRLTE